MHKEQFEFFALDFSEPLDNCRDQLMESYRSQVALSKLMLLHDLTALVLWQRCAPIRTAVYRCLDGRVVAMQYQLTHQANRGS